MAAKLFLAAALLGAISLPAADVFATFGTGGGSTRVSAAGRTVEATASSSVLLAVGSDFVNTGAFAFGWELPIVAGGPARALIRGANVDTEKISFMAVPGARFRFAPISRLSPWVSAGAGFGRFNRASVASAGNFIRSATESGFTFAVGGGLDWRVAGPFTVRGELRNFNYSSVDDSRRNTFQFLIGAGFRF